MQAGLRVILYLIFFFLLQFLLLHDRAAQVQQIVWYCTTLLCTQLLFSWPLPQKHSGNMRGWEASRAKVSQSDLCLCYDVLIREAARDL